MAEFCQMGVQENLCAQLNRAVNSFNYALALETLEKIREQYGINYDE